MQGIDEEKIANVAREQANKLREVLGGAIPIAGFWAVFAMIRPKSRRAPGNSGFSFRAESKLCCAGLIVLRKIDGAKIGVSRGADLRISRETQGVVVASLGLQKIAVFLGIDSEVELAGGISWFEARRRCENDRSLRHVAPCFINAAARLFSATKLFLVTASVCDHRRVIIVPVTQLNVRERGESEKRGDSGGSQEFH